MNTVKPRTLSGFMELLPQEQALFQQMMDIIQESYSLYGFTELDTPVIEASDVLLAKAGGETEKQIYRFTKGDTDLSLRFDLTVPLAKYVALHYGSLTFPFRRYQIGKVYRGERAQRGRFREFYQADIDIIGDGDLSPSNDAEIPAIISKVFTEMGLHRFLIRVNNRKILNGFYQMEDLQEKSGDIMRIVDKLEKIGKEEVVTQLKELGVSQPDNILDLMGIQGTNGEVLAGLEAYRGKNPLFDEGLEELTLLTNHLQGFGVSEEQFTIDLTIARGLDYYTGTVYETVLLDHPEIGSICSGGRYDNLAEYYTKKKLPGVGISIGLTRLFYVLKEQNYFNPECNVSPCDVLVLSMVDDMSTAVETATFLRSHKIRTQLYGENKKFKQKMSYADKIQVPFVAILGEDEIKEGKVNLKNMRTGEQQLLSKENLLSTIQSAMAKKCVPIQEKEGK